VDKAGSQGSVSLKTSQRPSDTQNCCVAAILLWPSHSSANHTRHGLKSPAENLNRAMIFSHHWLITLFIPSEFALVFVFVEYQNA